MDRLTERCAHWINRNRTMIILAWVILACIALGFSTGCAKEPERPIMVTPALAVHPVIAAGQQYNLPKYGKEYAGLTYLAKEHANSMARRQQQDHNGWEHRYRKITWAYNEVSEICAESWPGQSQSEAAAGCWKDWATSPSHWRTANGKPLLYGVAMSQGRNGIWYVCIIATWE